MIGRLVENALMTLQDARGRRVSKEEKRHGERFLAELRELIDHPTGPQVEFWKERCKELLQWAEHSDPLTFLRWPPIAATMTGGTTPHGRAAYRLLKTSPRWPLWERVLRQEPFGAPRPFLPNLRTNAITVQHASHLEVFQQETGRTFTDADLIVDVGAGYGSMCALIRRLGYNGQYVIFDQPPILALQRYYLALNNVGADYNFGSGVTLCNSLEAVRQIAANFQNISLISTWALSEMPIELRRQIEPLIASARNVILSYQEDFEGIGNRAYFDSLTERIQRQWRHFAITSLPRDYYLLGY